jgi:putative tryptophan/tyrosine transport system substrate-binding protein
MRRRDFIKVIAASATTWPLDARSQQGRPPMIGFLQVSTLEAGASLQAAFRQGMHEAGYIEGKNVTIEYRWAEGHLDRLASLAADLTHQPITVLAGLSTPAALAAKAATNTIPVVFETAGDPIKLGLVKSLNRPGGNVTGVTQLSSELISKRLGLLHELIPGAKTIGFLVDRGDPRAEAQTEDIQEAAHALGLQAHVLDANDEDDIDKAFTTLSRIGAGGLLVGTGDLLRRRAQQLAALAAHEKVPVIYQYRDYAMAGGLISYGTRLTDSYRQAGLYTGRILKGEKPADMPILRPTKFELVINLKTAKALGLTIPPGALAIADEVIE